MSVADSLLCEKGDRRRIWVRERPTPIVDDRGRACRAKATIAQVLGIVHAPSDLYLPPTLRVVRIGDDVTVPVLEDRARQVCLGIDAPKEIPVHREEVHERIREGMSQDAESPRSPAARRSTL